MSIIYNEKLSRHIDTDLFDPDEIRQLENEEEEKEDDEDSYQSYSEHYNDLKNGH